ncbi:hypothetical protein ACFQ1H_04345 [Scardovia wiggsiae]|uniref:hypothetical protein n=1 Tax=Scardovia wiggsiae TaxID=230143 RepID=UPI00362F946B
MTDITDKNSGNDKNGKSNEGGKSGKLQPKLRFKGFTDAWEQRALGGLYKLNTERNGNQFKANKTISISTMTFKPKGNGADNNSLKTYKVLRLGDVAYEGHTNNEFAYGRFVLNDIGDGIMSPRFSCLRPLKVQNILFWKEYIHSELVMRNILVRSTKKGTMMNELVPEDFLRNKIKVPSSREQECIGSLFRCFDSLIAAAERKVLLLKKKKHAYLNHIFTQHLRFTGHTTPWQTKKASTLFSSRNQRGHADLPVLSATQDSGIIYRDNLNIDIKFDLSSLESYKLVCPGDFIISLRSFQGGFEYSNKLGICSPAYTIFYFINQKEQDANYWRHLFKSHRFIESLKTITFGIRDGKTISFSEFQTLKVSYPEKTEQVAISSLLNSLDSLIAAAEHKVSLLKKKKQAYLQKMFV